MREQLIAYIEKLFKGTVDTQQARDFHDELLQNTLDRYDEEVSAGRSGEEAYRIAVLSLGNPEELLKPFYPHREHTGALRGVAIALYCTSFVPIILLGAISGKMALVGLALMFLMIALATSLLILTSRAKPVAEAEKARTLRAIGVGMVIASLSALMLGIAYENVRAIRLIPVSGAILGLCGMFVIIAAGIAVIVAAAQKDRSRTTPHVPVTRESEHAAAAQTPAAEPAGAVTRESESEKTGSQAAPVMKPAVPKWLRIVGGILTAIYWIAVVILFIFAVMVDPVKWYLALLVFAVAGALYDIVKGVVLLCCGLEGLSGIISAVLQLLAATGFYQLTVQTGMWYIAWLLFPIAGCLGGVASGIIGLVRSKKREEN